MRPITLLVIAMSTAVTACNQPNANRTTKAPAGVDNPTALTQPLTSPSAPPAPPMRDPVAASANTAAPGTNASVAFENEQSARSQPSKGSGLEAESGTVRAQEAAAKAPDTASADAAKTQVESGNGSGLRMPGTAKETSANEPRHGDLTKAEESQQMPKAGQTNNYSSPALEEDSGRGRKP